jgi:DNA-binding XRE family transcriptional regulator
MPDKVAARFASRLKKLRKSRGLSRYALAKKANIYRSVLCRLEWGLHVPNWRTVLALARALGADVNEFS